jgi:hypothetical protein
MRRGPPPRNVHPFSKSGGVLSAMGIFCKSNMIYQRVLNLGEQTASPSCEEGVDAT